MFCLLFLNNENLTLSLGLEVAELKRRRCATGLVSNLNFIFYTP